MEEAGEVSASAGRLEDALFGHWSSPRTRRWVFPAIYLISGLMKEKQAPVIMKDKCEIQRRQCENIVSISE